MGFNWIATWDGIVHINGCHNLVIKMPINGDLLIELACNQTPMLPNISDLISYNMNMCFQSGILMLNDLSPSKPWDYFELLNVQWKLVIPKVRVMVLNWAWIVIDWKLEI